MQLLDLTLDTPEANLALDEALLENAEAAAEATAGEWLRFWAPSSCAVVVGRSSHVAEEVHLAACNARGVPMLRRISGGGAIVTGPGCLMYALVLSYHKRPALRAIDVAHQFVLGTMVAALAADVPGLRCRGTSDLTIADRKVSGNSVRCRRHHLLYHGTLLYDFPLPLIAELLPPPPRAPDYRQGRDHRAFVTNLPLGIGPLKSALTRAWGAAASTDSAFTAEEAVIFGEGGLRARVQRLVEIRYGRREWNEAGLARSNHLR